MQRGPWLGVAIAVALCLAVLFWWAAPSAELDPEGSEAAVAAQPDRDGAEPAARAGPVDKPEVGEPEGEEEALLDPRMSGRGRPMLEERGGLKRLRTLLDELDAVEQELVPDGATPAEEDAILARPIARKAQVLDEMTRDVAVITAREDPARGARAQLLLADAHGQMAAFFRDRPVPSYLPQGGQEQYLDALEERARTQEDKAAAARAAASETALELPSDHPLRQRLR